MKQVEDANKQIIAPNKPVFRAKPPLCVKLRHSGCFHTSLTGRKRLCIVYLPRMCSLPHLVVFYLVIYHRKPPSPPWLWLLSSIIKNIYLPLVHKRTDRAHRRSGSPESINQISRVNKIDGGEKYSESTKMPGWNGTQFGHKSHVGVT